MDPYTQASLSPTDYYHTHPQAQSSQLAEAGPSQPQGVQIGVSSQGLETQQPGPGPRNYKSRKYRPCDFCRARQVACKIEVSPPCSLCQSHGRECTFVERPKKKRRPVRQNSTTAEALQASPSPVSNTPDSGIAGQIGRVTLVSHESSASDAGDAAAFSPYAVPLDPRLAGLSHEGSHTNATYGLQHYDEQLFSGQLEPQHYDSHNQQGLDHTVSAFQQSVPGLSRGQHARQLDSPSLRAARVVGETGEANPYLLRCYHFDENDECTIFGQTYRRVKRLAGISGVQEARDEPPPVFALVSDTHPHKIEAMVEEQVLCQAQLELTQLLTEEERFRLLGLYIRFVDPYFPILARSEVLVNGAVSHQAVNTLPLSLISAMYASALPFALYDELLSATTSHVLDRSEQLYRISRLGITQEAHNPRLSTLQAALLLLQRAPSSRAASETAWRTALVGWTVSLAYNLGLNRDSSHWNLPAWELALRKRLWHAVVIMDKWTSLGTGLPSHIRSDDAEVQPLWSSDCEITDVSDAEYHFRLLSELTSILTDILDTYYSVRASQRTSRDFLLSLDLARSLRSRLKSWSDAFHPPHLADNVDYRGVPRPSGDPSLRLAFIVANMTLLQALLRSIENTRSVEMQDHVTLTSMMAVRAGAREYANNAVEFVEKLERGATDAFWHSWSRSNFAIVSSFLMHLLVTATSDKEVSEVNALISRWRWAIRMRSSAASAVLSAGLLGLEAVGGDIGGGAGRSAVDVDGRM